MRFVAFTETREMIKSELVYNRLWVSREVRVLETNPQRAEKLRQSQTWRAALTQACCQARLRPPGPGADSGTDSHWQLGVSEKQWILLLPNATWIPHCAGPMVPAGEHTCAGAVVTASLTPAGKRRSPRDGSVAAVATGRALHVPTAHPGRHGLLMAAAFQKTLPTFPHRDRSRPRCSLSRGGRPVDSAGQAHGSQLSAECAPEQPERGRSAAFLSACGRVAPGHRKGNWVHHRPRCPSETAIRGQGSCAETSASRQAPARPLLCVCEEAGQPPGWWGRAQRSLCSLCPAPRQRARPCGPLGANEVKTAMWVRNTA